MQDIPPKTVHFSIYILSAEDQQSHQYLLHKVQYFIRIIRVYVLHIHYAISKTFSVHQRSIKCSESQALQQVSG